MNPKLLIRVQVTSRIIVIWASLLAVYLILAVPSMVSVRNRQEEIAWITSTTNVSELQARASGLTMVADNAGHASAVLFGLVILTLLLFSVVSVLNLIWLRQIRALLPNIDRAPIT